MNRKTTYKKLTGLYNDNCSKLLNCESGKKCFMWFRNRVKDQAYYWIKIKGNYIRGYRIQYFYEGKAENVFMKSFYSEIIPTEKRTLLVKAKFKDYADFYKKFKELTPDLEWLDRRNL